MQQREVPAVFHCDGDKDCGYVLSQSGQAVRTASAWSPSCSATARRTAETSLTSSDCSQVCVSQCHSQPDNKHLCRDIKECDQTPPCYECSSPPKILFSNRHYIKNQCNAVAIDYDCRSEETLLRPEGANRSEHPGKP